MHGAAAGNFLDAGGVNPQFGRHQIEIVQWAWTTCHIPQHAWEFSYPTALRLFNEGGFEPVAFRRSQALSFELSKVGFLSLPANLPALPGVNRYAGNQMEFLLRKVG